MKESICGKVESVKQIVEAFPKLIVLGVNNTNDFSVTKAFLILSFCVCTFFVNGVYGLFKP